MAIRLATDENQNSWEEGCKALQAPHHAFSWHWRSIISESFGHTPYYLMSESRGQIDGICPLFFVRSPLFGRALISVPYLNAGGILAANDDVGSELAREATRLAADLEAKYLELRHQEAVSFYGNAAPRTHKVSMKLPLASDPDAVFSKFSAKLRSQVRRPAKDGVTAEAITEPSNAVALFYDVFSRNMRDLGTPVYPRELFRRTFAAFSSQARIVIATKEGKPLAAGFTVGFGSNVEIPWASSLREFANLSPNMSMYWEIIRVAASDGYAAFDFGRSSPDSGTFRFKAQWGAKPAPLHWYYPHGKAPDINPHSAKFSFLVNAWQKLPLSVANAVGPYLTKGLP